MGDRLQLLADKVGHIPVLKLRGDLDAYTAEKLKNAVELLIHGGARELIINCAEMVTLDSSGIGTFISLSKAMKEAGGKLFILCVQPPIMKILKLTKVDILLKIFNTPEEIAAAVGREVREVREIKDCACDAGEPEAG